MAQVLAGFAVVATIIFVGYVLGHRGILGPEAQRTLNMLVFLVATPALLLDKLMTTDPRSVYGDSLLIAASSALIVGAVMYGLSRALFHRGRGDAIIGGLAGSYANGANIGLPLAAYVLGDATASVPLILFQVALYAPVALAALEILHRDPHPGDRWHVIGSILKGPLTNPIVLAAATGTVLAMTGTGLPLFLGDAVALIGDAAVPLALIAFGMSLSTTGIMQRGVVPRKEVLVAVAMKNILHPIVAGVIAHYLFGLTGAALFTAVLLGALPTAQNVYNYAARFEQREVFARDASMISTLVSLPLMILIAWLFNPMVG